MSIIANLHTCKNKDIINFSSIRPSKILSVLFLDRLNMMGVPLCAVSPTEHTL